MGELALKKLTQTAFPFGLIFLLVATLYFSILMELGQDWWVDPNYSHGFLIPLISGYFVWERRERLRQLEVNPCTWGILILLFGIFTLFIGSVGSELFTMRFSLIIVMAGLILFNLGKDFLKVLFLPIAFLVFMVPLPYLVYDSIAFPLKLFAAQFATYSLQLIELPVLREGNVIIFPNTTLEVADACSGIRSLISLIALGVVYAYFTQRVFWKRVVLVGACVPIAILVNGSRIIATGALAHFFGPELADGFFHTFSGWLIFLLAFLMLLGLGAVLGRFFREE
ncbi:MAG: exosortase A [Thermodesulfobacteriota bacterium]|nr:exosortase A [Thermodesulfobacteriota bacterium]